MIRSGMRKHIPTIWMTKKRHFRSVIDAGNGLQKIIIFKLMVIYGALIVSIGVGFGFKKGE